MKHLNSNSERATSRNLNMRLLEKRPVRVTHHIHGTIQIDEAKPLGFGSKSVMVRFHNSNGWTTIDPESWRIIR